jgi:DNA repair protein RAD16
MILKPIQRFGPSGEGLEAFRRLGILLDQIMLRRNKDECADDLGLPPRIVEVRRDYMNEVEEDLYEALFTDSKTKFQTFVDQHTVLNNYAHIFELLSKLRQAADHPFLVIHKTPSSENPGTYICGICHEVAEDPIASRCHHVFCRADIQEYIQLAAGETQCPACFTKLTINLEQNTLEPPSFSDEKAMSRQSIVNRIMNVKASFPSSTKINVLLELLTEIRSQDCTVKSIVFSQFVSFLDIVHWFLSKNGFNCVKLDGRMSAQQRDAVIKSFMTVPQITVFLVSLKAGGVALNLTEASRIFILDPWWNPAVEDQAMDRIHRLGQRRPVKITRLIIENSIESRIVQLQEKKQLLFQSTIGKDSAALERLSEDDLRFLFQM